MTPNCMKEVKKLEEESQTFDSLSVEQLLYAAIVGTDLGEVKYVLENTDWAEFCSNVANEE